MGTWLPACACFSSSVWAGGKLSGPGARWGAHSSPCTDLARGEHISGCHWHPESSSVGSSPGGLETPGQPPNHPGRSVGPGGINPLLLPSSQGGGAVSCLFHEAAVEGAGLCERQCQGGRGQREGVPKQVGGAATPGGQESGGCLAGSVVVWVGGQSQGAGEGSRCQVGGREGVTWTRQAPPGPCLSPSPTGTRPHVPTTRTGAGAVGEGGCEGLHSRAGAGCTVAKPSGTGSKSLSLSRGWAIIWARGALKEFWRAVMGWISSPVPSNSSPTLPKRPHPTHLACYARMGLASLSGDPGIVG